MRPSRALLLATSLASLAVVTACGGSPPPPGAVRPADRVLVQSDEGLIRTTDASTTRIDTVAVPPTAAMRALITTMEQLGIEATLVQPARGEVGNPRFIAQRRLAGASMSTFVSCGQTMTGQRADTDRIVFNILSTVSALPSGGSAVVTRVDANAQDLQSGNSTAMQTCTSTGVLEQRINEGMRARVGG